MARCHLRFLRVFSESEREKGGAPEYGIEKEGGGRDVRMAGIRCFAYYKGISVELVAGLMNDRSI